MTITGLSVAFLVIGGVEQISVLHDYLGRAAAATDWVSGIDLNNFGFVSFGLFAVTWLADIAYWRCSGVEQR